MTKKCRLLREHSSPDSFNVSDNRPDCCGWWYQVLSHKCARRNKNRLFVSGCMCTAVGQQQPGGDFCVALIFSKAGHLKRAGAEWLVGWLAVMHAHAKRATHYARGGRTITHLRPLRQPLFAPKAHHPGCLRAPQRRDSSYVCVVKMAK